MASTLEWARIARELQREAARLGLLVPAFRAPPRVPGDRTLRRPSPGYAVVAVRLAGRDLHDVTSDMIDGVIKAQGAGLTAEVVEQTRNALWVAAGILVDA